MNIILLSGGSGQRLWPLSNEIRSKQFIKIFHTEDGGLESMVQLVVDGRDLCLGCGNRDLCLRIRLPDLPVHPLHHGFIASVRALENFNELLGTDIVG